MKTVLKSFYILTILLFSFVANAENVGVTTKQNDFNPYLGSPYYSFNEDAAKEMEGQYQVEVNYSAIKPVVVSKKTYFNPKTYSNSANRYFMDDACETKITFQVGKVDLAVFSENHETKLGETKAYPITVTSYFTYAPKNKDNCSTSLPTNPKVNNFETVFTNSIPVLFTGESKKILAAFQVYGKGGEITFANGKFTAAPYELEYLNWFAKPSTRNSGFVTQGRLKLYTSEQFSCKKQDGSINSCENIITD